jgi:hypothetical protein
MSLSYLCPQCGKQITVRYLKVGEQAKCRSCGAPSVVPPDASEIELQDLGEVNGRLPARLDFLDSREQGMSESLKTSGINNPEQRYIPSGINSHRTFTTYLLFTVISAMAIQIPFGLTEALLGFVLRYSSGIWLITNPILFGGIGFLITGGILAYLIGLGTKRGHCRNPNTAKVATAATIALSLICRLAVTTVLAQKLAPELNVQSVLDLPTLYWIELLLAFGVVSFAAFVFAPAMKPYCETCEQYMRKSQHQFVSDELDRILSEFSKFTHQGAGCFQCKDWKRSKDLYPSVQVVLDVCEKCQSGFVSVLRNTTTLDGRKEKRESQSVYCDRCQPSTMAIISKALHHDIYV